MIDHLWISPHFDDAVLSSGGSIARAVARGESVLVATLFTRDPPLDLHTPFVDALHALWGLAPAEVMRQRAVEDARAMVRLGSPSAVRLDLYDAAYRCPSRYVDMETLLGPIAADDPAVGEIARALAPYDARVVHAPLAVGGHADHRAVRRVAAERWGDRVRYYEDVPYALRPGERDAWIAGLAPDEVDVTAHIEAKIEAIACYATQMVALFETAEAMPEAIRAYHRSGARFVEREWTSATNEGSLRQ